MESNIPEGHGEIVYCATPSRISSKTNEIIEFVKKLGYAPFHPFQAFPYQNFEGNPNVGREKTMLYCARAVQMCNQFWLFGLSEGTVEIELPVAKEKNKLIRLVKKFDPEWNEFAEKLNFNEKNVK